MRPSLFVTSGALMALLWVSTAEAFSLETACKDDMLRAASHYHLCLTRAHKKANVLGGAPSEEAIARCDQRFDRAFERAEASGLCRTPGGSSTLREPPIPDWPTCSAAPTTRPDNPNGVEGFVQITFDLGTCE